MDDVMKDAEKYFQALREAVGEEKIPLAFGQLKMAGNELLPERRRELASLHSNEARMKKLNEWFGHFLAPEVKNFIVLLAGKNELAVLDLLERADGAGNEAVVTSAKIFSSEIKSWLQNELSGIFGGGLRVRFEEDKSLIGGVRIRVDDREIDNSVRAKLAMMIK